MLDVRSDRYLALDDAAADAMRRWRDGPARSVEDVAIDRLLARGMLIPADTSRSGGWPAIDVPSRSLLDSPSVPQGSTLTVVPEIAALLWRARRRLRHKGLEHSLAEARRRKSIAGGKDPLPHLSLFRAARRLVPITPHCLTDSLALSTFLGRRNVHCDLVFGVKLDPFAAHCWLQDQDGILNDSTDSVTTFTPIMAI